MPKSNTQLKAEQRERDKAAGFVRYERKIRPEWAIKLDAVLNKLRKRIDI